MKSELFSSILLITCEGELTSKMDITFQTSVKFTSTFQRRSFSSAKLASSCSGIECAALDFRIEQESNFIVKCAQ